MSELSNAVTVLIARMESHPEDFAVDDGELYSKSKFGEMVNGLYALTETNPTVKNAFWYLNDADKQALVDAWKKYHYTKFEKRVMEKIFDDGAEERERLLMKQQMYQAQIRAQLQGSVLHPAQNTGGLIGSSYPYMANTNTAQNSTVQPWQNATNAAQNSTGITTNSGGFLSGIFK